MLATGDCSEMAPAAHRKELSRAESENVQLLRPLRAARGRE